MTQKVDATARVPVGRNSKRIPPFLRRRIIYHFSVRRDAASGQNKFGLDTAHTGKNRSQVLTESAPPAGRKPLVYIDSAPLTMDPTKGVHLIQKVKNVIAGRTASGAGAQMLPHHRKRESTKRPGATSLIYQRAPRKIGTHERKEGPAKLRKN